MLNLEQIYDEQPQQTIEDLFPTLEPEITGAPTLEGHDNYNNILPILNELAHKYNLDPKILAAIILHESNGNANAEGDSQETIRKSRYEAIKKAFLTNSNYQEYYKILKENGLVNDEEDFFILTSKFSYGLFQISPQTAALRGFRDNPEQLKDARTNIEIAIKELMAKGFKTSDTGIDGLMKAAEIINGGSLGATTKEDYKESVNKIYNKLNSLFEIRIKCNSPCEIIINHILDDKEKYVIEEVIKNSGDVFNLNILSSIEYTDEASLIRIETIPDLNDANLAKFKTFLEVELNRVLPNSESFISYVKGINPFSDELVSYSPMYSEITPQNLIQIFQTPLKEKFGEDIYGAKAVVYFPFSDDKSRVAFLTEATNTHHIHAASKLVEISDGDSYEEEALALYFQNINRAGVLMKRLSGFELQYDSTTGKIIGIKQDSWITKEQQKNPNYSLDTEFQNIIILELLLRIPEELLSDELKATLVDELDFSSLIVS